MYLYTYDMKIVREIYHFSIKFSQDIWVSKGEERKLNRFARKSSLNVCKKSSACLFYFF